LSSGENAMTTQTEAQEMAFVEALRQHENRWVAFIEVEDAEVIVGSGSDAVEAMTEAEAKGFPDAVLLKVPPFNTAFIPLLSHSETCA
jgi:threonine dehydratase